MSWLVKLIVFVVYTYKFAYLLKNDTYNLIIGKILKLKVPQVCIFINENNSIDTNEIVGKFSPEIPTFIIDNRNHRAMNIRIALSSDLYVFVEHAHNFDGKKIEKSLKAIVELNPLSPRKKCLVILIGYSKSTRIHFEKLLTDAWDLKFLDFSILTEDQNFDVIIFNYNPFFKSYQHANMSSNQIFPDKLKNMYGYKLNMLLYSLPPVIEFSNKSNKIVIDSVNYGFLKLATSSLNCKLDYLKIEHSYPEKYIFEKLEKGEIDLSVMAHLLSSELADFHQRKAFLIGRVVREADMNLIVPLIYKNNSSIILLNIITYFCLTVTIIFFVILIFRLSKLTSATWTPFYIFALLFGITVKKKPRKLFEKLVYTIIAFLSIQYSSDIFAIFSNDDVVKYEEIVYDAFEEIKSPSFPIHLYKHFFPNQSNYDDEIIKSLKAHSIPIDKSIDCYKKLAAKKNCSCLNSVFFARHMIKKISNPDKSPLMKITQPPVLGDFFVHIYSKGSPYMKKFDKKFQQILKSGLHDSIFHAKKYFESYRKSKNQDISFKPTNQIKNQLLIFSIGCFISILNFVFELTI